MITRRQLLTTGAALLAGGAALSQATRAVAAATGPAATQPPQPPAPGASYTPVVTLNGSTLPWRMDHGIKVFHLIAEPVKREFSPGMVVNCWGYNGSTPGPTIEAVEGDRVRIYVTNRLPERTAVHWHGVLLPNGMDGVGGLTQPHIPPGKTFAYEFTLDRHGTFMYHPHSDEMFQMAMGMQGFLVVHPRRAPQPRIDRDYLIMLHNWYVEPGTYTPNPMVMTDFNIWTMNSRIFPGVDPMVARTGERVRIRIANISMHDHPMHIHGFNMTVTGTDGGWLPASAQWPETTVLVPVGNVRVVEFVAHAPGDWAFHCHKSHHTMNAMSHDVPNLYGVNLEGVDQRVSRLVPQYMPMGRNGMGDMQDMAEMGMRLPENTLPMMTGKGPFGQLEMGGMFTVIKVRDDLAAGDYRDPGWYTHPEGTVAWEVPDEEVKRLFG